MAPLARVVHTLPGRKRIRIPEKRGDEVYFNMLKEGLAGCPGVLAVEANPATAGVLVHHATDALHFLDSAVEQELFRLNEDDLHLPVHTPSSPPVSANPGTAAKSLPTFRSIINLRRLMFLGLIGTGIVQAFKGNIVIPALAALTDAIRILPRDKE